MSENPRPFEEIYAEAGDERSEPMFTVVYERC
jgi:hypothetical protein